MSQLTALVRREKPPDVEESSSPVVKIQKMIFDEALGKDARHVHIEPGRELTRVRYRVNGVLKELRKTPRSIHENLVVRVKVLARLDIIERRIPQDGHIAAELTNGPDMRVSILPTRWGEKIVIDRKSVV